MRGSGENGFSSSWESELVDELGQRRAEEGVSLELRRIDDRLVHVLAGRALENGATLELLLDDGRWIAGIYDWSGAAMRWPGLRVALGQRRSNDSAAAGGERSAMAVLALHPDAILRWPRR